MDSQSLLEEAYRLNENIPSSLHPNKMTHGFRPLLAGAYPMLSPTDLITFSSESASLSTLTLLLGNLYKKNFCFTTFKFLIDTFYRMIYTEKIEVTSKEIKTVIQEGMILRRQLLDA